MLTSQFFRDWYYIQYSAEQQDLENFGHIKEQTKNRRKDNPEIALIQEVNECFGGNYSKFINNIVNFGITEETLEKNSNLNKFIEKRLIYCFSEEIIKIPENRVNLRKPQQELGLTQTEVTELIAEHEKKINVYR